MNRSARTKDAVEWHGQAEVRSYRPSRQEHNRNVTVEGHGCMQSPILSERKNPYRNKPEGYLVGVVLFGGVMVVLVTLFLMMQ